MKINILKVTLSLEVSSYEEVGKVLQISHLHRKCSLFECYSGKYSNQYFCSFVHCGCSIKLHST